MERKYRQKGYMDSQREAPQEKRPPKENLGGPRPMRMPGRSTVLRCAGCGTVLRPDVDTKGARDTVVKRGVPAHAAPERT